MCCAQYVGAEFICPCLDSIDRKLVMKVSGTQHIKKKYMINSVCILNRPINQHRSGMFFSYHLLCLYACQ